VPIDGFRGARALCVMRAMLGSFAVEEDAARAYDCVAVQAHGPGAKRNFPGEDNNKPPATVGEERKQRKSSRLVDSGLIVGDHSGIREDDVEVDKMDETGTRATLHGACVGCVCGTHRPSAGNTLDTTPLRRTQPGRMAVRLCRRTDQAPSATSQARPSASRL
jgi:hypothetical protein